MKYLVFCLTFLLTSCAMVDAVKGMFDVTYEVGKVRGRQEIINDLVDNKKKLDDITNIIVAEAIMMVQKGVDDPSSDKLMELVIPISGNYLMLKRQRSNLKKELAVAHQTAVQAGKED